MTNSLLYGAAALIALALLAAGPAKAGSKSILIGVNLELSGRMAVIGNDTLRGIRAAHARQPELLGRSVKLSICDNASTVQGSVACAKRFIREGVAAVLGSYSSSHSIAAGKILQKAGVPMVSTGSTNPATTKIGDYIFRTSYTDDIQGRIAARIAYDQLGARRVAIFRQPDDHASAGLTNFFKRAFEGLGGQATVVDFAAHADDFTAQINKLRAFHADMIYFTGFCPEAVSLLPQLRRRKFDGPVMGGDAMDDAQCPDGGGKAFDGFLFTSFGGADVLNGKAAERAGKFGEFFHKMFPHAACDGFALTGADAYKVVAEAIEQAGGADPARVRDKLARMKDFPGVSGEITYAGTDGTPANRVMGLYVYKFADDGSWKKVTLRGITMDEGNH